MVYSEPSKVLSISRSTILSTSSLMVDQLMEVLTCWRHMINKSLTGYLNQTMAYTMPWIKAFFKQKATTWTLWIREIVSIIKMFYKRLQTTVMIATLLLERIFISTQRPNKDMFLFSHLELPWFTSLLRL